VTIRNNYFRTNSDGIDPVSCRNVRISDCHIVAGDDCIVMKTRDGHACENVVVSNCTLESIATAVKLGTESSGDFRNIHVRGCSIRNSTVGIGIYLKDGGTMERITFSDIDIENYTPQGITNVEKALFPIFMDIERRHKDSRVGVLRDIQLSGIQIISGGGLAIQGMPESKIENVTLRDVAFRVRDPLDYNNRRKHVGGRRTTSDERDTLYVRKPAYVALANIDGLTVDNLRVHLAPESYRQYPRLALHGSRLDHFSIRNVFHQPITYAADANVLQLEECGIGFVADCFTHDPRDRKLGSHQASAR
jgi:hypothetical protein